MIRFEPRDRLSPLTRLAIPVGAAVSAVMVALLILALTGQSSITAGVMLVEGAAGSVFAITETLTRATPLIFCGLAAAVAFQAKFWNIGAEGQLYAGALAAVAVGGAGLSLPSPVLIALVCLAGAAAGAAALLGPAILKARFGVEEVVTTLLLNFVMLLVVQMMLEGPMKDPMGMGWPQSVPVDDAAALPRLVDQMRLHAGFVLALVAAGAIAFMMSRTVIGFEMRAVGGNQAAARFAGVSVGRTMIVTALVSGALAGLGGTSEVAGLKGYLTADLSPGFGSAGIVVAMLAGLNPLAVIPSAIFIAGVFVGADTMSRTLGISNYFADLVVAISLIAVLIGSLFTRYRVRLVRRA